ncbi:MAG: AAA family ATPase, partial [Nocardiaceae bacterium]|nr:AAA family ATPase [Nocardiaceae bacterium]
MIVATRSTGALRAFNEAGYVDVSDVQVALRLGRLARETNEHALLAVALTVAALRAGSVCLELHRMRELPYEGETPVGELPWPSVPDMLAALKNSPLIVGNGKDPLAPMRLVGDELLYLTKYYEQEREIARILDERATTQPQVRDLTAELGELFPNPAPDRQRVAAALALSRWTTVLVGGPGTGKTHTVARILALLRKDNPSVRVGLAAPTGKAAAQLEESVRTQAVDVDLPEVKAVTLHRLLGWLPGAGARYRHNATNRLPYDVVVVDECSMVPLTMMYRLLVALRPTTRLILVGDPDQLASVDAGAVLADLVARRTAGPVPPSIEADLVAAGTEDEPAFSDEDRELANGGVARLSVGRRFNADIAALAAAVRDGDADRVVE